MNYSTLSLVFSIQNGKSNKIFENNIRICPANIYSFIYYFLSVTSVNHRLTKLLYSNKSIFNVKNLKSLKRKVDYK